MPPLYYFRKDVTRAQLKSVQDKSGVVLSETHLEIFEKVNGSTPRPGWIRKKRIVDEYGDTAFVTGFARFDRVAEYCMGARELRALGIADNFLPLAEADRDTIYIDVAGKAGRILVHRYVEGDYSIAPKTVKRFQWFPSFAAFEDGSFNPTTMHKWLGLLAKNEPWRAREWLEDGGDPNLETPYFPTPFEQFCAHGAAFLPSIELLIEHGADIEAGLAMAREKKQRAVVKFLEGLRSQPRVSKI